MVKISLDDINLSKMSPEFVGETDRTCKTLNNYLVLKTLKIQFHGSMGILRTKIVANINKIGGISY